MRNDWDGPTLSCHRPVCIGVVAFVRDDGAGCPVWPGVDQIGEQRAVRCLASGQLERNRQPVMVCFQMDLRAEPATRPPKRLARLPPFAPAAETCARITVESNICTRCAVPLSPASIAK